MYPHTFPMTLRRALAPRRLTAGLFLTSAFLSSACSEPASRIAAPPLLSLSGDGPSAAALKFAVLGNAAVTCTNGTIKGNVGTFLAPPTGSVTLSSCPLTGTVHVGDVPAKNAYNSFLGRYAALAPTPGDDCRTLTGTLDGRTLKPGAYCFPAGATLTGVVTLNGPSNKRWTFRVGTSGTGALSGTNFSVVMAGGGQACNVTWWVADGATMTTSAFRGNILAGSAIALTGGSLRGNAWARADATVTGTAVTPC